MAETHYDTLQVTRTASPEVIRAAYKSLSQRWHPDRNLRNRAEAERMMTGINMAYAVLSDPRRRTDYDAELDEQAEEARQRSAQTAPDSDSPRRQTDNSGVRSSGTARSASGRPAQSVLEPKGWLRFLIVTLFCLPVLSGLSLYGEIHHIEESIHESYVSEWKTLKNHFWFIWSIVAATQWSAGWLLNNHSLRATRWLAASLIWLGAILAPVVGAIAIPPAVSAEIANPTSWGYLFMGIRGTIFALVCSLYLAFSKRVKATYTAAAPKIDIERVRKNALYSLLGLFVVLLPIGVFIGGVAILNYSLWGLLLMALGGIGFVWLLVRPER